MGKRLTEYTSQSEIADTDVFYSVDVSDTSQDESGSTKKTLWSLIKSTLKTYFDSVTTTLTNKTLTSPVISQISNTGTLTLPTSTDTLVGRATTDTLTNKTIDGDVNTISDVGISSLKSVVGDAYKYLARDSSGAVVSISFDGWIGVTEAWTRTGGFVFTVSGDLTAKYRKGTKVRYKDGGSFEYGVIGSSSYSAPNTTVTLITNADYAMANSTITEPAISYIENPEGFPQWFNWTPTFSGFSSNPTNLMNIWTTSGNCITLVIRQGSDGTSNSTSFSITAPILALSGVTNGAWGSACGFTRNNSVTEGPTSSASIVSGESTITMFRNGSVTGWTNSGGKRVSFVTLIYPF